MYKHDGKTLVLSQGILISIDWDALRVAALHQHDIKEEKFRTVEREYYTHDLSTYKEFRVCSLWQRCCTCDDDFHVEFVHADPNNISRTPPIHYTL
jgi:hypothetical protein